MRAKISVKANASEARVMPKLKSSIEAGAARMRAKISVTANAGEVRVMPKLKSSIDAGAAA
jgi:osmotically-inducible protein OsmY